MKQFATRELREAIAYAAAGGQALHLHRYIIDRSKAPSCFKAAITRGQDIAHLFDQDEARLVDTVKRLGVRVISVERRGQPGQHVDLCGWPLERAKSLCEET